MDAVEEIKQKLSIVDVVSKYAVLKQSGSTMKACCPFHKEKTASFHVFPDKGTWHCFGACGVGGDIFAFVQRIEHVDFKEALRILSERAGVPLAERDSRHDNIMYELNNMSAEFFVSNFKGAPLEYMQRRGFDQQALSRFQIGLSPADGDKLLKYLTTKKYKTDDIIKAGLAVREQNRVRDYFIWRIIFPIKNEAGQIIGFAGRALDGKSKVKYINSPNTPIYSKRSILWGIYEAKASIRAEKALILVEGYTDVMMSHQHGFSNTVGLCGSSLTPEHLTIIKRYAKNVLMALDPDAAGEQATLRGIKIARNVFNGHAPIPEFLDGDGTVHGDIKIIELPNGKDPDVCIHENPAEWQLRIMKARPVMDYLFDAVLSRLDLNREVGRASAAEQLMPIISDINDPVERELYTDKLAKIIGTRPQVLRASDYSKPITKRMQRLTSETLTHTDNAEETCLAIILKYGRQVETAGLVEKLTSDHFARIENRELFNIWRQGHFPDTAVLQKHYDHLCSKSLLVGPGVLQDCIDWLENNRVLREQAMLMRVFHDADPEERLKLADKLIELRRLHADPKFSTELD